MGSYLEFNQKMFILLPGEKHTNLTLRDLLFLGDARELRIECGNDLANIRDHFCFQSFVFPFTQIFQLYLKETL